jgi:hypothetical protein
MTNAYSWPAVVACGCVSLIDPMAPVRSGPLSGRPVEAPLLIALVIYGFSCGSFRNHSRELE